MSKTAPFHAESSRSGNAAQDTSANKIEKQFI
jgi:hypothetical protein